MSCRQTTTSRYPIVSNAGAMAAGYAIESSHAFAADAICRRPLLHPASQEDGRRAAIRHFLNTHGRLLPATSVPSTSPGLIERTGQTCTALARESMRQAGMLVDRLSRLAMAIDAGLRFPTATAGAPDCAQPANGQPSCYRDGGSGPVNQDGAGTGGVSFRFDAGTTRTGVSASSELQTEPGNRKQARAPSTTPEGASRTFSVESALAVHAYHGDLRQVDALLQAGADVNDADANRNTALIVATRMGQANVVRRLLEAGARVDSANHEGLTALHMAVLAENVEVVGMLLKKAPPLNQLDHSGFTPLSLAVQNDHPRLVQTLLAAGADPNIAVSGASSLSGLTPLLTAVLHKQHEIAGLLLDAGADVHYATDNGRNAIRFAVQRKDPEMVDRLSRADANPCTIPPGEQSAFQEAVESGHHDMVESMLRHAKSHPCPPLLLMDALQRAVYHGDLGMTSLLLEHGAPADQEAQTGALGLAIQLGHDSIADLLRKHGARQAA
ncbi:ankyrin repeat domain-containing protein|uniref:ankyrin repeat domain-containing protein n=1 Tax=Noviherbaspirillum sp. L7-7A TaxID=2850560 RepID=UPI001C2BCEF8|nr:ankyrin repeat domain-containing protein [Noviherbaspirillum sp. L7-7A]MBV0880447.1 ankyrin repeat domain-containing protein [Noviherbaspirillum sp. L7-7A]